MMNAVHVMMTRYVDIDASLKYVYAWSIALCCAIGSWKDAFLKMHCESSAVIMSIVPAQEIKLWQGYQSQHHFWQG